MHTNSADSITRILRAYDLLNDALAMLERAGQDDVCATLYLPLGLLEERFDLTPSQTAGTVSTTARKNRSIADI